MIASEAVPFAKTGGLGDVVGTLPRALARLGWSVTIVVPRYRGVGAAGATIDTFAVTMGRRRVNATCHVCELGDHRGAVLVECPEYFDREELYGVGMTDYPDSAQRFGFLSRAALEWAARRGVRPSVVHAHDWQAGLVPVYLRSLYETHPVLGGLPSVFTLHNVAFQGLFAPDVLGDLDLDGARFTADGIEYWGQVSFLKGGLNFSDLITTVSPTYAREVQTPEYGFGFEGVIAGRRDDLVGILNGIDDELWDPQRDPLIPAPYGPDDMSGKQAARQALLGAFGLPADDVPPARAVVGMVSRMVAQKGLDLLAELGDELSRLNAAFVVLGTGDAQYEQMWRDLAAEHPDQCGVRIGFDERLAHLVEAGSDIFLMPSRFEPCGLNQMYSLRYGTVPVVHATGGLDDTVTDYDPVSGAGNGFKFARYDATELLATLQRALGVYADPARWEALRLAGMSKDYSWDAPARQYVKVYERAAARRRSARAGRG